MNKKDRQNRILSLLTENAADALLTTDSLARELNTSAITIRRDLKELADAGLIQRQHGGLTQLKSQVRTQRIGLLLVTDSGKYSNPFRNEVLEGADEAIQQFGYNMSFVKTSLEVSTNDQIRSLLLTHPIEGLLVVGGLNSMMFAHWKSFITNIVATPLYISAEADTVFFDGFAGIQQMIGHLYKLGHRRIAFITGTIYTGHTDPRKQAYLAGILGKGLEQEHELLVEIDQGVGGWIPTIGEQGAQQLMNLAKPPDAIMCASDQIAFGALQWLQANGYRVPTDVAVTGFDNLRESSLTIPALTTVHVHKKLLGRLAVEFLHRRIANPNDPPLQVYTPTSLVIRQSCGA
ncbi:MAG: DeoR family transcriptional regulator [Chloroflexi bacterium]|nr:DeoR family transcriptional regulator [Chloroflexota bacterium]